ncbi:MAG: hypothetical protein R3A52_00980 [Polyangiales bacterium]
MKSLRRVGCAQLAPWVLALGCAANAGGDPVVTDDVPAVDAGTADAGTMDAGANDAGARDAGANDTGVRDAGVRDAGVRDVGTDAGPRDAGAVDAGTADPYDSAREHCVAEINRYRAMIGLAPYARWRAGESCADQMAANDARTGVAHDGFNRGICSPRGNGQNECPRYGGPERLDGCLAQMWAEGPSADGSWDTAHGHYLNMIGDYTYMGRRQRFTQVACGFSAAGWMVQNFQ